MSKVYGFKEPPRCPKCLTDRQFANVRWGAYQCVDGPIPAMVLGAQGVLRVECNNCGFAWLEDPADAEPKAGWSSDEYRR